MKAVYHESILGFRKEASAVTSEFRERVSPFPGTLGAAYVLRLSPGRWKWRAVYFNEPASLRHGCRECLDHWCDAFTGRLRAFAASLCKMGHDLESVKRELEEICQVVINVESRNWLACFCGDGNPAGTDWRAPGWLLDWPDELETGALSGATSNGRLDGIQTREVCEKIQHHVTESLAPAKVEALNQAAILIAERDLPLQSPQTALPVPLGSIIQEMMNRHPDLSFRDICGKVDDRCDTERRQVPVPRKCKKHGHTTLVDSIDCDICRNYMKSFLSTQRRHLGLSRPPKSEFLQKTKVAKFDKVRN